MATTLAEAAATSTAHGIGKAASAQRTSLRVMWILLFLTFLALFLKGGVDLVIKLKDRRLIKEYHAEKVPFVFPDVYFCPSNAYSGSFPHTLTKPEADFINSEISSILRKFDKIFLNSNMRISEKLGIIQQSLPFTIIANYLIQRIEQSVIYSEMYLNSNSNSQRRGANMIPFYLPGYLVCFKLDLDPHEKLAMQSPNGTIDIALSTDSFFPEVKYSGHPINSISGYDLIAPFKYWHSVYNMELLLQSGYTMLLVPPGAYPSLEFETSIEIGPGSAYSMKLEMTENKLSEELHGTYCVANAPDMAFENPLTGERELFKYSSAVCNVQRRLSSIINKYGCRYSSYPMLWEHKFMPRCKNLSEMNSTDQHVIREDTDETIYTMAEAYSYCKKRVPCNYQKYSASSSVGKWPSLSRRTAEDLVALPHLFSGKKERPGLAKLLAIARQILSGNHSSHLEDLFRMFLSESLLKVRISAASTMSSQVVLTWSYTVTDFLADTGGLLGLYIGCSLLTLCELLELLYILVERTCKGIRSRMKDKTGEADATVDDKPKDISSAADAEQKC